MKLDNLELSKIRIMTNEEELELIKECKKNHPECYTPEWMEKYQAIQEMPCCIPGIR